MREVEADALHSELVQPRKNLPPLLYKLTERRPEALHYLGVSYGLTPELFSFWAKPGLAYKPVYLRQTSNELTGEHTCVMLHALQSDFVRSSDRSVHDWVTLYYEDFRKRFLSLLGYEFRSFSSSLSLSVTELASSSAGSSDAAALAPAPPQGAGGGVGGGLLSREDLTTLMLTTHDLKRLDSYAQNLVDYHVIVDLLPLLARLFFMRRLSVALSPAQKAIFLALGLQHRTVDDLERELALPSSQILALFNKSMRKIAAHLREIQEQAIAATLPAAAAPSPSSSAAASRPAITTPLEDDLDGYRIRSTAQDWNDVLRGGDRVPSTISVKKPAPVGSPDSMPTSMLDEQLRKSKKHKKRGL